MSGTCVRRAYGFEFRFCVAGADLVGLELVVVGGVSEEGQVDAERVSGERRLLRAFVWLELDRFFVEAFEVSVVLVDGFAEEGHA